MVIAPTPALASASAIRAAIKRSEIDLLWDSMPESAYELLKNSLPGRIADMIADALNLNYLEKLGILCAASLEERLMQLSILINRESEALMLGTKIHQDVQAAVGRNQREFFLREQLRAIQEELGNDFANPDLADIAERMNKCSLPEAVETKIRKEVSRLELIPTAAAEYHVAYNYVDWLLSVPWGASVESIVELARATAVLDEDH